MSLIKTPYAAVIVWNYEERLTLDGFINSGKEPGMIINEIIVSTVSLISISTSKSKSSPVGSFNFTLAPTRNWTAVLTSGSWCAILMSNEPIVEDSFKKAKATQLKMIGRIDAIRTSVTVDDRGTRSTSYAVQGRDWGSIFENVMYVDPMLQDPSDKQGDQANAAYQNILGSLLKDDGTFNYLTVPHNLHTILSVLGQPLNVPEIGRLFKAVHEVSLPDKLVNFLRAGTTTVKFMELLELISGPLKKEGEDDYDGSVPELTGYGWLNASALIGQHSIWSVLQENHNDALNELYPEIRWKNDLPEFRLYCRIKPFSYTDEPASNATNTDMRSKFQNIYSHLLDTEAVMSVSAGVNWADKFNFLEIKPNVSEWPVMETLLADKSQAFQGNNSESAVYDREGFRPIIFSIKQLPFIFDADKDPLDTNALDSWVQLAKEWYFDSHKFLNGTVSLYGSNEYIPVGDNIMFDAQLVGVTRNYNRDADNSDDTIFVLAHVESVQNEFSASSNGARSFQTTVNFVRGILVNKQKQLIGFGTIDSLASMLRKEDSKNSATVFAPEEK